jgi:hypothetical protein
MPVNSSTGDRCILLSLRVTSHVPLHASARQVTRTGGQKSPRCTVAVEGNRQGVMQ